MEFNKGEASFFKQLLNDSDDYFPIPCDFAMKYLEGSDITQKVVLKTTSGKKWAVGYLKIEGTYYFVNGWLKFVKDNGLESTDYLVFWLRSPTPNAIFRVAFYSPNGSPEHLTCHGDGASFIQILFKDSHDYLRLPYEFSKKYLEKGNHTTQKALLQTKSGSEWTVKYLKIVDKYYFMDGWFKFINDNGLQKTDFIVFSLRSHVPTIFRVYLYSDSGSLIQSTSSSCNIPPKSVPVGNKSKAVTETCRDNHSSEKKMLFDKVIRDYISKDMPLPEDFERVTGIDCRVGNQVRVKNDQGTIFIINTTIWKRPVYGRKSARIPYLREGWSEFLKASNVEVGDTCVFYYLKDEKMLYVQVKKTGGSEDKGKKRKRGRKSKE